MQHRLAQRLGFTGLTLTAFGAMDATFKCLVIPAYIVLIAEQTPLRSAEVVRLAVRVAAMVMVLWFGAMVVVTHPVRRWLRAEREGRVGRREIENAGRALRRLPPAMAVAWAATWSVLVGVLNVSAVDLPSGEAAVFFLCAMVLGPLPLAHSLTVWLVAPIVRRLSLVARRERVIAPASSMTLRSRMLFYGSCMCLAPTSYMTAVVFSARAQLLPMSTLLTTVGVYLAGVAVFAVLLAILLATTITGPVAEMAKIMRGIERQGDVSHAGRVPLYGGDEVGALAELTNTMLDRLERTAAERSRVAQSLERLNHDLEQRVVERTAELRGRTLEMSLLLDNVNQGLFTVDRAGVMSSEHSASLDRWFGAPEQGITFFRYFAARVPDFGRAQEMAWEQVVDGVLPLELTLDQMPARLVYGGRIFTFSHTPIGSGAERFLIVVSDITDEVGRELAEREKKQTLALFEHMLADRRGFAGFVEEASAVVARVVTASTSLAELKRDLHTLKGNSALYGLNGVAESCHALESLVTEEGTRPSAAHLLDLQERWVRVREDVDRLLGERHDVVELSPVDLAGLEGAVLAGAPRKVVAQLVRELGLEPVERRLRHFAEQASCLGERLEKRMTLEVVHDGLRLDPRRWNKFWSAFVHAVRNAVDHGIEPSAERVACGKAEGGRIALRARREGSSIVFEIEDDGRGIDWDRVRAKASGLGLPVASHADLVRALVRGGVSTAAEVTDISGRGVGMGALRAAIQELDGKLDIQSEAGGGTCLRMVFPERCTEWPRTDLLELESERRSA